MQHLSMMNVEKYLRVRTHLHVARQRRVPLRMRSELRLRGSKRTHYRRCGATDSGVIALSIGAINICGVGNRKKKKNKKQNDVSNQVKRCLHKRTRGEKCKV